MYKYLKIKQSKRNSDRERSKNIAIRKKDSKLNWAADLYPALSAKKYASTDTRARYRDCLSRGACAACGACGLAILGLLDINHLEFLLVGNLSSRTLFQCCRYCCAKFGYTCRGTMERRHTGRKQSTLMNTNVHRNKKYKYMLWWKCEARGGKWRDGIIAKAPSNGVQ